LGSSGSGAGKLPKMNFPQFDGDNPKLWLSRAVDYFELYEIEEHRWIMVASMNFVVPASRWLQSVQIKLKSCSWKVFADMVLDRFGCDQHELLIRQLFHIKQTSSVEDYIDRFVELVDQLSSYENNPDPLHFTMRFIDGLREDLRAAVLIQRPSDLDTAFVLAKLQDEVAVPARKREFKRIDPGYSSKHDAPLSWTVPGSVKTDKASPPHIESSKPRPASDRWSSLKSFRRAQGLCQHCAEKWTRDHKCSDKIQPHALQEVLEVFQTEDHDVDPVDCLEAQQDQLFLSISDAALSDVSSPRTMTFAGSIQNIDISILVDSGSSNTFISSTLASKLKGVSPLQHSTKVQVANGHHLHCDEFIPQAEWVMAGYPFQADLKVLPLSAYDLILGFDWLESFNPMKVHWSDKWMSIPYKGSQVLLCGDAARLPVGTILQLCTIQFTTTPTVVASVPPEIQSLLEEFSVMFVVPTELPPPRACDHSIPLVDGVAPVSVRPYRFSPAIKDEIERQI
jgi:hypothetical protein